MTDANQEGSLQDKAREQLGAAKEAASKALHDTRDKALHAFEASRDAARGSTKGLDGNPIGLLAGGLAIGAVAAALIPRSERERQLLAPVGKRLSATAVAAFAAAKENAQAELSQRGLTKDGAQEQARSLFEGLRKALTNAGGAAVEAARAKSAG